MEKFRHIYRDRGHNSYGYSKSRLGCFNGSLYIFPFTRSMGKKWTLEVKLIELRNQTVSLVLEIILESVFKDLKYFPFKISLSID